MKFLLDQDVPQDLSYLLVQLGHNVTLLRKVLPEDTSDERVLQFAHDQDCLLLTYNRDDFLQLAKQKPHSGVIYRHPPQDTSCRTSSVVSTIGARRGNRSQEQHQLCLIPRLD